MQKKECERVGGSAQSKIDERLEKQNVQDTVKQGTTRGGKRIHMVSMKQKKKRISSWNPATAQAAPRSSTASRMMTRRSAKSHAIAVGAEEY